MNLTFCNPKKVDLLFVVTLIVEQSLIFEITLVISAPVLNIQTTLFIKQENEKNPLTFALRLATSSNQTFLENNVTYTFWKPPTGDNTQLMATTDNVKFNHEIMTGK